MSCCERLLYLHLPDLFLTCLTLETGIPSFCFAARTEEFRLCTRSSSKGFCQDGGECGAPSQWLLCWLPLALLCLPVRTCCEKGLETGASLPLRTLKSAKQHRTLQALGGCFGEGIGRDALVAKPTWQEAWWGIGSMTRGENCPYKTIEKMMRLVVMGIGSSGAWVHDSGRCQCRPLGFALRDASRLSCLGSHLHFAGTNQTED